MLRDDEAPSEPQVREFVTGAEVVRVGAGDAEEPGGFLDGPHETFLGLGYCCWFVHGVLHTVGTGPMRTPRPLARREPPANLATPHRRRSSFDPRRYLARPPTGKPRKPTFDRRDRRAVQTHGADT